MAGRSRGRAKIRTEATNPPAPDIAQSTAKPEPPKPIIPEVGRGRGITSPPPTPLPKEESKHSIDPFFK